MPYNTGNPVPSTDPRDFKDNVENVDKAVNNTGTWTDRLGVSRDTLPTIFDNAQSDADARYSTFDSYVSEKESTADSDIAAFEADLDARLPDAISQYSALTSRGEWASSTSYLVNDLWLYDGNWYFVPADYTSGATADDDIDNGDAVAHRLTGPYVVRFPSLSEAIVAVTASPSEFRFVSVQSRYSEAECATLSITYPDGGMALYEVVETTDPDDLMLYSAGTKKLSMIRDERGISADMLQNPDKYFLFDNSAISDWLLGADIKINCIGDSLTYGYDTTSTGTLDGINGNATTRNPNNYPDVLEHCLSSVVSSTVGSVTVNNYGYPGDTVDHYFTRWQGNIDTDADFTFICYGKNDAKPEKNVSFREYANGLERIVIDTIRKGSSPVLMAPPASRGVVGGSLERFIGENGYRKAMERIADKYQIPFIDMRSELSSYFDVLPYSDGTHLSSLGYAAWGNILSTYLFAGFNLPEISVGDIIYSDNQHGLNCVYQDHSGGVPFDYVIKCTSTEEFILPLNMQENCVCVVTTYAGETSDNAVRSTHIVVRVDDDSIDTVWNGDILMTHGNDPDGLNEGMMLKNHVFGVLPKGPITLRFRNPTSGAGKIARIDFYPADWVYIEADGKWSICDGKIIHASGLRIQNSIANGNYFVHTNRLMYVSKVGTVQSQLHIDSADAAAFGVGVFKGNSARDGVYMQITPTTVIINEVINGSSVGTATDATFTIGTEHTLRLELRDSLEAVAYVDDVQRTTLTLTADPKGYAGIMSNSRDWSGWAGNLTILNTPW